MPLYVYTAKNAQGQTKNGMVDARSQDLAVNLLKAQNLFVVTISEKKENFIDELINLRGVPRKDLVLFTRQFATMILAGLQVARCLEILGNQTQNKLFKRIIFDVLRLVEGGSSLSSALAQHSNVFDTSFVALIRAGESSGKLDEILKRLAETMEAENELNVKFKSAMIYPVVVFMAMIGVFIVLMVFVIPKLSELYTSMNVELPLITKIMITTSKFMTQYIVLILGAMLAGAYFLKKFLSTAEGKKFLIEVVYNIPVFGGIMRLKEQAQFTRTLSLLISAAVPIVEALNIVSGVVSHPSLRNAALEAAKQVEKGNPLSGYFSSSSLFPPLISQMTSVGEETGKMDEVLQRVASYYDLEVDGMVKGLSSALEPLILVMLGVMVGFMILSVITPIYKITTSF
jgi:type IV pilus assembly protein PilC